MLQSVLNAAWTWLFLGRHRPREALLPVGMLWTVILATFIGFWRLESRAGVLLIPYLARVPFAGALNWAIWRRNLTVQPL